MPRDFPEPDWKTLSRLKALTLDRLCQRILQEAGGILDRVQEGGHHRTYLDLYRHIQENDKVVGDCFNNWSRSHALDNLINWRYQKLITDEEFAAFSLETRTIVNGFLTGR
jgi:hypothetical protein